MEPEQPLAHSLAVFDAHVDSLQRQLDLGTDLGVRSDEGHLDCERGLAGGLGACVFVSWVDPKHIAEGPGCSRARTEALLGEFHRLVARHPERIRFAGNASALAEANAAGCIAGIPGIEGGHSLEENIDALDFFFERGVRVLTLVWNNHLSWIRSCRDGAGADVPAGLSEFGRSVVRRMNELGMIVDLSHAGEQSFYDALEVSTKPVIASHSGCTAVNPHPRNLKDDQLRALAKNGGVVGIVFCTPFLSSASANAESELRRSEGYRALDGANDTAVFVEQSQFLKRNAPPLPIEIVVQHVEHAIEIAGIDHVGLGSDFDGIENTPQGLDDASCYGALASALSSRGMGDEDLAKVLGGNMRRVFAEVTAAETRAAAQSLVALPI